MQTGSGVFVLKDANTLVAMQAASFASEDDFQRLLASFPELLVGDQIDRASPRRFALVAREQAIASEDGGAGRWSLDHLFLDQDGIPTLIEVKRSTDTRIRREVVGQMMDYASHAVFYWPVEELRARFRLRCEVAGQDPDAALAELVGSEEPDAEAFWAKVKANLQAGRIRLIFVSDRIPAELRRIVEFMNQQMSPAEVLAIELRQFEGQELRTLVPVVYGRTEAAVALKQRGTAETRAWDQSSLLTEIGYRSGDDLAVKTWAFKLVGWIEDHADEVVFNDKPRWGSMTPLFRLGETTLAGPIRLWSDGSVEILFSNLIGKPVFGEAALREEFRTRLNAVGGIALPLDAIERRPSIKPAQMTLDNLLAFEAVLDWFAKTLRSRTTSVDATG